MSSATVPAQPFAAVVVAAGSGARFGADRPKALLPLAGSPIVRHAVQTMLAAGAAQVVVVAPEPELDAFAGALDGLAVDAITPGGSERTHSVRAGLAAVAGFPARPAVVLVHDAARPLVPVEVVGRVVAAVAAGSGAVVPAVPVTDTVRELTEDGSRMLDRTRLRAVQTPQGFDLDLLLGAYRRIGTAVITDDAGVCEQAGHPVTIVDGAADAFKITYPADLQWAEELLARRAATGPAAAR